MTATKKNPESFINEETAIRFEQARDKIIGKSRQRHGIGTLSEKTVHAVLKNFYAPDEDMHEIPIGNYVADIYTGKEIIEIQTRNFNVMRSKLAYFLEEYPVTVVYPIPRTKWLSWIDEETGECSPKRKSPLTGSAYMAFPELYKIKAFLKCRNLHFRFVLMDMEEYRLLNGWSRDRKKGSSRFDRIPTNLVKEVIIERPEDYMQFIPPELVQFTSAEFARAVHIKKPLAQTTLHILNEMGMVKRIGKQGRSYLYEVVEW
ncbi:MAG: hypothetical protein GX234_01345 [Clostridiales bacterium]|nr:hypothetical protein [Clostridiales bacterium]